MDRLSLKGHEIRVIDYEILWRTEGKEELYSKRRVFQKVSRVCKKAGVTVIRPSILKIRGLDKVSLVFSHRKEINRQIIEFEPDIVIGFGVLNTYFAMRSARKRNIPFIYYLLDELHTLVRPKSMQPLAKFIEGDILRNADAVIVLGSKLRESSFEMGADPKRMYLVKNGVQFDRFNPHISGEGIRKDYGIQKDDFVLFFMGTLWNFSGLKEVALGLSEVRKERPIKLLIVGKGELYGDLMAIREKYNLQDCLILAGRQPYEKMPEFVAASNICLLPAQCNEVMSNIVPIKMYEYMSCAKPVLSTKLPGVIEEFGFDNGVIYVDKPERVIEKAVELMNAESSLEKYGLKARRFAQRYDWKIITMEFENVLKRFINS